jgi:hypothetical protein
MIFSATSQREDADRNFGSDSFLRFLRISGACLLADLTG